MNKTSLAAALGVGFRDRATLVSAVTRHLALPEVSTRATDRLHPSALAHDPWCERAAYYALTGVPEEPLPRSLAMEVVFEGGHHAHAKWQRWFREMGVLYGTWRCLSCGLYWEALSPVACPRCEVGGDLITYAEVPLRNDTYLIGGHADGDVRMPGQAPVLIEIKTIGTGTVRFDAPALMSKYSYTHVDDQGRTHTGVDWDGLWRGIRRPFPSHLRQGMLYCFCAGRDEIIYIYEPKFVTAYPKEFEIRLDEELIHGILEKCLSVKQSVAQQRVPKRPMWTSPTCTTCKSCGFRSVCYGRDKNRKSDGTLSRAPGSRQKRTTQAGTGAATPARVRFTEAPPGTDGPG